MWRRFSLPFLCLFFQYAEAVPPRLARVEHLTRVKIIESNGVTTRPGSIYDNRTYFESLLTLPKPQFFYEFIDTGLGTAEPLYPMMQAGHQGSWFQLFPAFFSEEARHIDHYSSLETPEGCLVDSLYMLRNINEFGDLYSVEKDEGYDLVVLRFEHYAKLREDAVCGRHEAKLVDPKFSPQKYFKNILKSRKLTDIPARDLERFDAKVSAIRHLSENFIQKGERDYFDPASLNANSLWYFPEGHLWNYGLNDSFSIQGLSFRATDLVIPSTPALSEMFSLTSVISTDDFERLLEFLDGQPTPYFHPDDEPGRDQLRLDDVMSMGFRSPYARPIYSSGTYRETIFDIHGDIENPDHFKLVGIVIHPNAEEDDIAFKNKWENIPQIRMTYQMMDPRNPTRPFEQLYFHINFDAIDRRLSASERGAASRNFLFNLGNVLQAIERSREMKEDLWIEFLKANKAGPAEMISFSSALTGIWTFGALTRTTNETRELQPLRIQRAGVDVGYYSTSYDNDLFQEAAKAGNLEAAVVLHDLRVEHYRDKKRQDAHAIQFQRMTCAQCHQMSGRDGVHFSFNDRVDPRFTDETRLSEFVFRELERQLKELSTSFP